MTDQTPSGTAPLKNMALFMELIERLQSRPNHLPGLGVFYGPSGYGKTVSSVYGANKHGAYYIECGASWGGNTLLDAILHELTGHKMRGPIAAKCAEAIRILAEDTRPLIIDEADHLIKKVMVDVVREIADKTSAPVILIGEEQIASKLMPFERAHNRVLEWVRAEPCDLQDAQALARLYAPKLPIADDLLTEIVRLNEGCTRRVVVNIDRVRKLAQTQGLLSVDLAAWGATEIYTGSPKPRPPRARVPGRRAA